MFVPKLFAMDDRAEKVDFMRRYSFGIIVNVADGVPVATHLPFLIEERDDDIVISGHYAKANTQSALPESETLVIFSEPHAYISPSHYEKETNVPTWNYVAVHAYGKLRYLETEEQLFHLLKRTIETFEAGYLKQWENLPDDYRHKMVKGIVGFEIAVTDLQGKKKLSQNKTENERNNIIHSLDNSDDTAQKDIAEHMRKQDQHSK